LLLTHARPPIAREFTGQHGKTNCVDSRDDGQRDIPFSWAVKTGLGVKKLAKPTIST